MALLSVLLGIIGTSAVAAQPVAAQEGSADLVQRVLPNPNPEVALNWAVLPDDRVWGSSAGIDIDPTDGHVWVYDRCGGIGLVGGCAANPTVDPILKYDRNTGQLLAAFGAGLFVLPHGLHVDDDGNVWVTDSQGNGEIGHQVFKFSPEGEVLLTLGVAGEPGSDPNGRLLNEPTDVITWGPTGDIFVSDGHSGQDLDPPAGRTGRILKYDRDGNFIRQWGEIGFRPGQFRTPHALEFDSQGRLFVADRGNHRIQIFDQEGELLDIYYQFGRISGLYITADDTLYAIDSESQETNHYGWLNGVRIGPAAEDRVTAFIPPHFPEEGRTLQGLAGEGIAVDEDGNVFVAEGPASRPFAGGAVTKYSRGVSPIRASRLFTGPNQYPPADFGAYGILAFSSRATSASRARYLAICEGFLAGLSSSTVLADDGLPLDQQMATVWPLYSIVLADELNAYPPGRSISNRCAEIVADIDLETSLNALALASQTTRDPNLNDDGPYLLAWSPGRTFGRTDVLVLVSDFSNVRNAQQATRRFAAWREDIQEDPDLWNSGFDLNSARLAASEMADKLGEPVFRVLRLVGE